MVRKDACDMTVVADTQKGCIEAWECIDHRGIACCAFMRAVFRGYRVDGTAFHSVRFNKQFDEQMVIAFDALSSYTAFICKIELHAIKVCSQIDKASEHVPGGVATADRDATDTLFSYT